MTLPDPCIVWKGGMTCLEYRIVIVPYEGRCSTCVERLEYDALGNEAWRRAPHDSAYSVQSVLCEALIDALGIRPTWDPRGGLIKVAHTHLNVSAAERIICYLTNYSEDRDRWNDRFRLVTVTKPDHDPERKPHVGTTVEVWGKDVLGAPIWRGAPGTGKAFDPTELFLQSLMPALGLKPDWDWRPSPVFEIDAHDKQTCVKCGFQFGTTQGWDGHYNCPKCLADNPRQP